MRGQLEVELVLVEEAAPLSMPRPSLSPRRCPRRCLCSGRAACLRRRRSGGPHAGEEPDGCVDLGLPEAAFGVCALTGALVYGALGSCFRRWPVCTVAFLIVGLPRFVVAAFTDASRRWR